MSKPARHLLLATGNRHKTREVAEILGAEWSVEDLNTRPEATTIEETGATFAENARLKAAAASAWFDGWVLADDSGLEVDALEGAPGVRSARYAGEKASMAENRALLRERLENVRGKARSARFHCALALAREGEIVAEFSGVVEGTITPVERGAGGFGYDCMFVPAGYCGTFAELPASTKNRLSHRARALAEAVAFLRSRG